MSAALVRLALFQIITIVLTVLFAGLLLFARFGTGSHFPILATYARDYGMILLLVPAAWVVWSGFELHRPRSDSGDGGRVFLSGLVLLGLLACFGFFALVSALTYRSLLIAVPPPPSVPEAASLQADS